MTNPSRPSPTTGEACLVVAICFGWFIFTSMHAVAKGFPTSGSFSDGALAYIMAIECFFGAIALTFLHFHGYSLEELLPSPTLRGCLSGTLLAAMVFIVWGLMSKAFFANQLETQPITAITAAAKPSLAYAIAGSMLNGLYEETFLLGYLVRGFETAGASFALGLSLLVRVLYHLYQGPFGAVSVLVCGFVISYFYWRTRVLWPAVFAHTLIDAWALT